MIKGESQVSRKMVKEDRIAICPQIGCIHLEKVKPLKLGILGFRKYPKCSNHKIPLVFVEEFIENFFDAVNACLFDNSSLPPVTLINLIKAEAPDELMAFINGWMYCNPIGRGAQVVSQYIDGLSRAYMKLLNRKQKKALNNEKNSKNRYSMLRSGLKKIADEYTTFLQEFRDKSELLYDPKYLGPLSDKVQKILDSWLRVYLNTIKTTSREKRNEASLKNESLPLLKEEYGKILHSGTCALLLGKSPPVVTKTMSAFELFSAYHEFLKAGLCRELNIKDLKVFLEEFEEFLNVNGEHILDIPEENENFNESDNMKDKINSRITSHYGFARIRNLISLYLFELIIDKNNKTHNIVSQLENDIKNNTNLPNQLTQEEILFLHSLMTKQREEFLKYFSDLTEVIRHLFGSCVVHKKIGALLIIKYIAKDLNSKGVNLSQNFVSFYESVKNIFDFLKKRFPNIFPIRSRTEKGLSNKERHKKNIKYRRIVGNRIKIYIIKNIYNGIYFKNKLGKCPECEKEGLRLNTTLSRLKALEFHHTTAGKEYSYTSNKLYHLFNNDRSNPEFLEDLIAFLESKKVRPICGNHHDAKTYKHFNYFRDFISWINLPKIFPKNIFALSPELIHTLIRISVDNHLKTKNLPLTHKDNIRIELARLLKKRYIIETFYGESCHICNEFSTKFYLTAFQFNHKDENKKTIKISKLSKYLTCTEIIEILEKEEGGYLCSNCHTVLHNNKYIPILHEIYDDKNIIKRALEDYNNARKKFKTITTKGIDIKNPLEQSIRITDGIENYLTAVYEISKSKQIVTNTSLCKYLGYSSNTIPLKYFNRNEKILKQYVNINKATRPTTYSLTKKGLEAVNLMVYFKKYYKNLTI